MGAEPVTWYPSMMKDFFRKSVKRKLEDQCPPAPPPADTRGYIPRDPDSNSSIKRAKGKAGTPDSLPRESAEAQTLWLKSCQNPLLMKKKMEHMYNMFAPPRPFFPPKPLHLPHWVNWNPDREEPLKKRRPQEIENEFDIKSCCVERLLFPRFNTQFLVALR